MLLNIKDFSYKPLNKAKVNYTFDRKMLNNKLAILDDIFILNEAV